MGNLKGTGKPLVPTAFQVRTGPYIICTNEKLPKRMRRWSASSRRWNRQVEETLGLKVDAG